MADPDNDRASLAPDPTAEAGRRVDVRIYVITGRHGLLSIPEGFCKECNLFIRAVQAGMERVEVEVDLRVLSWWGRPLAALWHGGYHPPVLVIDGERVAQGYDVPTPERVARHLEAVAGGKGQA